MHIPTELASPQTRTPILEITKKHINKPRAIGTVRTSAFYPPATCRWSGTSLRNEKRFLACKMWRCFPNFYRVAVLPQSLEFLSPEPELSFLKICPSVVHLRPREGARIEVSFCPPVSLPGNGSTAAAGFDGRETSEAENQEKEAESDAAAVAGVAAVGGGIGGGKDTKKKGQDKTKATTAAPQKGNSAAATTKSPAEEQPEQRQEGGGGEEGNIVPTAADATRGGDDGHVSPVPRYAGDVDESGDGVGEEHGEEDEEDFEGGQEPWSQHGRWRVPCFLKKPGMQSALGRGKGGEGRPLPPLALEVSEGWKEAVNNGHEESG